MKNHDFDLISIVFKHVLLLTDGSWFRPCSMLVSITVFSVNITQAQIMIGLMAKKPVQNAMVSPQEGSYILQKEELDTVYKFRSDDAVSFTVFEDQIIAKSVYGFNDTLKWLKVSGSGLNPTIKMRLESDKKEHKYFGSIKVSAKNGTLNLVNDLNVDTYVGMVVQAEVGYGAVEEYYKIQSIICRTYAMRNLERHALDGYDLCDNEHCQVFSGLKQPTNEVIKATAATSGSVMVDPESQLILSAFHANCGGQTSNSEDVWRESRSYLTSVEDTFCLGSRSAVWNKSIPLNEFLSQIGFSVDLEINDGWSFSQSDRKKHFAIGVDSVETSKMRRFLQLKSTYFNLDIKGGVVKLYGRGYGHGVGLCQQGAMKMAEHGYSYSQILGYYYKGVSLVPISTLQAEK